MRRLALVAALIAASPAAAFTTRLGERVEAQGADGFQVLASPGQAASASWCAAGDYVLHALGLPPQTRIWRVSAPPRRQGEGVAFALAPEGATVTGLFMLGGDGTDGLSAAFAESLCYGLGPMKADDPA